MGSNGAADLVSDTSDMVVIHRLFRREFARMPQLVRAVEPGDLGRANRVAGFIDEFVAALHHHHSGEDELLWPRLTDRSSMDGELVRRMSEQHVALGKLLEEAELRVPKWRRYAGADARDELAGLLDQISTQLDAHLAQEEAEILPVVREHITTGEWDELGERGFAAIPPKRRLVFLGYILQDTSESERHAMLSRVPPPARLLYRAVGQRKYRREIGQLLGSAG